MYEAFSSECMKPKATSDLRVERRVLNQRVDEHHYVVLDLPKNSKKHERLAATSLVSEKAVSCNLSSLSFLLSFLRLEANLHERLAATSPASGKES